MILSKCCHEQTFHNEGDDYCDNCKEVCEVEHVISCKGRGCESNDAQPRNDAHGIPTGNYCESCYENNYPYRKDRYPTIETHGYGEQLEDDEPKYWNDMSTHFERFSY